MAKAQEYDLIIAGGGTIGCLLALSLASSGLNIAIVEGRPYAREPRQSLHPGFDARSVALSHQSGAFLMQLGLQTPLLQNSIPIKQIKVSDQGHSGQCLLQHQQLGGEALGYVTSQQQLGAMLYQPLQDCGAIHWFCPDTVVAVQQQQDSISVSLGSDKQLSASLLVVAEGGNSATAAMLGLTSQQQDYQQVAVVANIKTDRCHQYRAYERFTAQGPLALLPNSEQGFGLVWSISAESQQIYQKMSDKVFLQQLQQAFGYSAGRFNTASPRSCYPLALYRLNRTVAHRAVVIGNAAHTLHPIAGQGFNLGLRDVQSLSLLLQQAARQQGDPGRADLLQQYHQQRAQDQNRVINSTDALVRIFSNSHRPLVWGRNLGLGLLDLCPPLRMSLAKAAMGYGELHATS